MIIISGPSTVGKNPLIYKICELYGFSFIIPYTTRKIRNEESDKKDYFFISIEEFKTCIRNNLFDYWDYALSNYYGFKFDFSCNDKLITHSLSRMALRIKSKHKNIITVFLMPENINLIYKNLESIYSGNDLALRKALVREEICHSTLFDSIIITPYDSTLLTNNPNLRSILL